MSSDSLITVVTGVLQAGGLGIFVLFLVRGITARLISLEGVVEAQKRAIESVEVRANEAEKVAAIYKALINDLPDLLDKQRKLTDQLKDDIINAQEALIQSKDEKLEELADSGLQHVRSLEIGLHQLQEKSNLVLGLDIGAKSVGWALMDQSSQKIIDLGVRIFNEKEG